MAAQVCLPSPESQLERPAGCCFPVCAVPGMSSISAGLAVVAARSPWTIGFDVVPAARPAGGPGPPDCGCWGGRGHTGRASGQRRGSRPKDRSRARALGRKPFVPRPQGDSWCLKWGEAGLQRDRIRYMLDLCEVSRPLSGFHGRCFDIQGRASWGSSLSTLNLALTWAPGAPAPVHLASVTLTSPDPILTLPLFPPACPLLLRQSYLLQGAPLSDLIAAWLHPLASLASDSLQKGL